MEGQYLGTGIFSDYWHSMPIDPPTFFIYIAPRSSSKRSPRHLSAPGSCQPRPCHRPGLEGVRVPWRADGGDFWLVSSDRWPLSLDKLPTPLT